MDMIRSAYEVDCRFYAGEPDKITRIRWYFADPGAEPLPYRHRFGSANWEQPTDENGPVGEMVPGNRRWYSGHNFTGALGVGTSVPESLWVDGCGAGDVLTGTECEAGFWESVRAGLSAFIISAHQQNLQTAIGLISEVHTLGRMHLEVIKFGFKHLINPLIPPPNFNPPKIRMRVGLAPVPAFFRGVVRKLDPKAGFKPGGRLGKGFVPRLRPVPGFKGKALVPVPGGVLRAVAPPPVGMAPILKGGKLLVGAPPPVGMAPIVKAGGKRLVSVPCWCFVGTARYSHLFVAGVTTGSASSSGTGVQTEKFDAGVTTGSATSSGTVEQVEKFTAGVTTGSATSSGTYTDVGGVTHSFDAGVTTGSATSSGTVEQVEKFTAGVTTGSATSSGVYTESVTVGCCSNAIIRELTATLANVAACSCVSGSFVLNWNSSTSKWEGTGAFGSCGRNVTLKVYCGSGGTTCGGFKVDASWSDSCHTAITNQAADAGCACSPLSLVFTFTAFQFLCGCTSVGPPAHATWKATITP